VELTPSRLAIARKRRGFTPTRLAELTGLNTHSLSVYENGHQVPSEDTLPVLAGALDITPDFLAGPDVERFPQMRSASGR
jgi:transcriptional regulator with XRE-family HTH domain